MFENKKATIGATMTWVVATIIILMVIIVFVYAAGVLAGSEWFENLLGMEGSVEVGKSAVDSEQMLLALMKTKSSGETLKQNIEKRDYNEFKKDFDKIENEISFVLDKFPKDGNDLGWTFIIKYLEPVNQKQKDNPSFIMGVDPYDFQDILETQGTGTRETYDCSFVYLINSKVTLCKMESL